MENLTHAAPENVKNAASGQPDAARKNRLIFPLVGALVFFIILWKLDFPKPAWDDLFYTGPALNMAQGGDFSNPLLARQGFPSHYYYVYPPFHPYAVYAWLCLWGISTDSLVAFQNVMYFIIAAAMMLVLRRQGAPKFLYWLVPLGVTAVFLKNGFRPEPFGVALTMLGYTLLLRCRKASFGSGIAYLLLLLGAGAAPRTAFFSVVLGVVGTWQWSRQASSHFNRPRFFLVATTAGLASALIFLALIGFRPAEFLETFHYHATRLNGSAWGLLHNFMIDMGSRWWPIFFLTLLILCVAVRRGFHEVSLLCYALAGTFVVAIFMRALCPGSCWYLLFILFLLTAASLKKISRIQGAMWSGAVVACLLLANSTKALEAFGILTGKIQTQPPANLEALRALKSTPEHPLLVDTVAARYIFDYRLPARCINYEFSAPFPGFQATTAKLRENDVFVLGSGTYNMLNELTHFDYPIEQWVVFGIRQWSYPRFPTRTFVIPARECIERMRKGVKAD